MINLAEHTRHELFRALELIREARYVVIAPLAITAWVTAEPVPFAQRTSGKKKVLKKGDAWASLFDCAWFRFQGTVPKHARGQIAVLLDVHGEMLLVDATGNAVRGLTTKNSGFDQSHGLPGKHVHRMPLKAGGTVDLWADGACNDLFGKLSGEGRIRHADIALEHHELNALFHDLEVVLDLAKQLPQDTARAARLWEAARRSVAELRDYTEAEAPRARAHLAPELARRAGDHPLTLSAVGHAHMDLAWLWPVRETKRKTARTFATVLRNMERYPEYIFGASQPQQYAWIKESQPALWKQIKQRVAEGRWECQGAMWCEPDTNLASGEALARQLLYGTKFFVEEFGKRPRNLWLPDVFGYSGSLPQLLRHAGVENFMTIKLSWSTVNRFPHHTFHWQGIDGSSVLAHMPPQGTYNSAANPSAVLESERQYREKAISDRALLVFGIGDGGGGPGEDHLERLARCADVQGLPKVVQEPAEKFFARLQKQSEHFPRYCGELYLEKHQGTYTTQAANKKWNRRMEWALRSCELAAARAALSGSRYPQRELVPIWHEVLLYQFHDILPGSSITRVYDESLQRYAQLHRETTALTTIADQATLGKAGTATAIMNDLSWDRSGWIHSALPTGRSGSSAGTQWSHVTVPALGSVVLTKEGSAPSGLVATPTLLDNGILRVRLAIDGTLSSVVVTATGREVLNGPGNVLAIHRDHGDAWDFSLTYTDQTPEKAHLTSTSAHVDGPHAIVKQVWSYGASTITQQVVLTAGSQRLEFRTAADWQDGGRMVRTSFPVTVQTDAATCHIQFGTIQRATHRNTSWDAAKDEICAHTFVDLSERTHGVALLNDGKYGHRVHGNVLDLHLLRTPNFPDPVADRTHHTFTYALYPHVGDHVAGHVLREGYDLNCPLRVVPVATSAPALPSLCTVDAEHVVIEAIKRSEDGNATVFRLFESAGAEALCTVRFGFPIGKAWLTDLHEKAVEKLIIRDGAVMVPFKRFQIVTLRVS